MSQRLKTAIATFVAAREKKRALKAAFDVKAGKIQEVLSRLETIIMEEMPEGVDSVKTDEGTAYRRTESSVAVEDWEEFLTFVRKEKAWGLLNHGANKSEVEAFLAQDRTVPGIRYARTLAIGVRKAMEKGERG